MTYRYEIVCKTCGERAGCGPDHASDTADCVTFIGFRAEHDAKHTLLKTPLTVAEQERLIEAFEIVARYRRVREEA